MHTENNGDSMVSSGRRGARARRRSLVQSESQSVRCPGRAATLVIREDGLHTAARPPLAPRRPDILDG